MKARLPIPSPTPRAAAWLLAVCCAAFLPLLVHPWYTPFNDSSIYISCAQSLATTGNYALLGEPFTLRPPGFSVFLAPIVSVFGLDFHAMNAAVSLVGVAGIAALFLLVEPALGIGLGLLLALTVWLNPRWQSLSTTILSDIPGFALALAALAWERRSPRPPTLRREVILGALIGVGTLVRSINVLLLPAVLLARLVDRFVGGPRPAWRTFLATGVAPVCAAVLVTVGPWSLRNALVQRSGPAEQTAMHSYGTAQWRTVRGDPDSPLIGPADVLRRLRANTRELVTAVGSRGTAFRNPGGPSPGMVAVAVVLIGGSLVAFVRRREAQDFFLAANVAVLLVYFDIQVRLFLPVFVLALAGTTEMALAGLRRAGLRRLAAPLCAAALVALAIGDFAPRRGWEQLRTQHEARAREGAAIAALVPAQTRLGAYKGVEWSPYVGRPVYGLIHLFRRSPSEGTLERIIDRYRLEVIIVDKELPRGLRDYLARAYADASTAVPGTPFVLYRVRPAR
jgi:hypothetical protein